MKRIDNYIVEMTELELNDGTKKYIPIVVVNKKNFLGFKRKERLYIAKYADRYITQELFNIFCSIDPDQFDTLSDAQLAAFEFVSEWNKKADLEYSKEIKSYKKITYEGDL